MTVLSNTSEIGQGTGTAIAQILADELDLEWKRIRLEMARVENGEYATYGSGGIAGQYEALRTAGAQVRARLMAAAAARWKVPAAECDTSLGTVVHAKSRPQVGLCRARRRCRSHSGDRECPADAAGALALRRPRDEARRSTAARASGWTRIRRGRSSPRVVRRRASGDAWRRWIRPPR